jgi:hypothetical protein
MFSEITLASEWRLIGVSRVRAGVIAKARKPTKGYFHGLMTAWTWLLAEKMVTGWPNWGLFRSRRVFVAGSQVLMGYMAEIDQTTVSKATVASPSCEVNGKNANSSHRVKCKFPLVILDH